MAKDKQNKRPQQPNLQDTSKVESNQFFKGMTKDPDMSVLGKENWSHAINAINNSAKGDVGVIGNEQANLLCADVPYQIIGGIHLFGDKWILYSTDNTSSEIGIFDDSKCEYKTFINDECLSFNQRYLITGASKENFDCSWQVYWDDGTNPSRTLNIGPIDEEGWFTDINVPWERTATTDGDNCVIYENNIPLTLDCDRIRLAPYMRTPCIKVSKSDSGGQLKNGSYQVFIAYTLNENKIGDYIAMSTVQPLFDHDDMSGSLDINITDLDTNFEFFELVILANNQMQNVAKRIGFYSTVTTEGNFRNITIDFIDPKLQTIDIETLPAQNPRYEKSDKMYALNDYLIRQGPYEQFDFNYQCQANEIETMWVSTRYSGDYYRKGGNKTTFMRDEQYSFFIRFVYRTGERSSSYHIPGRDKNFYPNGEAVSNTFSGGDDGTDYVASYSLDANEQQNWQVLNTAIEVVGAPGVGDTTDDGGVVIAKGYMGYWESTEVYPTTDPERWCELCGDKIRHHKMPDEQTCIATRRSSDGTGSGVSNGQFINILGAEFNNITRPRYNDGTVIENITGYEILVGSRKGAKSIIAKGLLRNMRGYNPDVGEDAETGASINGLFPNYPFNDLRRDPYIVNGDSATMSQSEQESNKLGTYYNDIFTFHSPETSFNRPYLSPFEVKSYGRTLGGSVGRFKRSEDHPKHKLIRDIAAIISAVLGAGYAIQEMRGPKENNVRGAQALSIGQQQGPYDNRDNTDNYDDGSIVQQNSFSGGGGSWSAVLGTGGGGTSNISGGGDMDWSNVSQTGTDTFNSIPADTVGAPMDGTAPGPAGTINPATGGITPGTGSVIQNQSTQNMDNVDDAQATDGGGGIVPTVTSGSDPGQEAAGDSLTQVDVSNLLSAAVTPVASLAGTFGLDIPLAQPQEQTMILATTPLDPGTSIAAAEELYMRDINQRNENAAKKAPGVTGPRRDIKSKESKYKGLPGFLQLMFKIHSFLNMMTTGGQEIVELVYNLMSPQDYVLKYNGYGLYHNTRCEYSPTCGGSFLNGTQFRREIDRAVYISNAFQNLGSNFRINNLQRPKTVVLSSQGSLPSLAGLDLSRQTMGSLGGWGSPTAGFYRPIAAHYVGLKMNFENQYGQLDGIMQLPTECVVEFNQEFDYDGTEIMVSSGDVFKSPVVFGGDCYLNRYSEKVIMPFFWDFLKGEPDEVNFNYYLHQNIPGTRYWYNGDRYNLSGLVQPFTDLSFSWLSDPTNPGLPSAMHNLDRAASEQTFDSNMIGSSGGGWPGGMTPGGIDGSGGGTSAGGYGGYNAGGSGGASDGGSLQQKNGLFTIKGSYMYVHSSGINEFFVESEINTALRDWDDARGKRHYDWQEYTDLTELFHAEIIKDGNYYKYDHSLSKVNFVTDALSFGFIQDLTYDPLVAENCLTHYPKRVIYSLQAQKEAKKDFWRVFLPNNYRDFKNQITVIKPISKTGALMLFPHLAPQQFQGVDTLTTEGDIKITIGDAGLFNQAFQNVVNADLQHEYGSCESFRSVINTPTGLYYISQEQGKIFSFTGQLEAISDIGMKQWFNKYLPSRLLAAYPAAIGTVDADNSVAGVGCQAVYDPNYDIAYFSKKDYEPLGEWSDCIQYDPELGFVFNETLCGSGGTSFDCPDGFDLGTVDGEPMCLCNDNVTIPWENYELVNTDNDEFITDAETGDDWDTTEEGEIIITDPIDTDEDDDIEDGDIESVSNWPTTQAPVDITISVDGSHTTGNNTGRYGTDTWSGRHGRKWIRYAQSNFVREMTNWFSDNGFLTNQIIREDGPRSAPILDDASTDPDNCTWASAEYDGYESDPFQGKTNIKNLNNTNCIGGDVCQWKYGYDGIEGQINPVIYTNRVQLGVDFWCDSGFNNTANGITGEPDPLGQSNYGLAVNYNMSIFGYNQGNQGTGPSNYFWNQGFTNAGTIGANECGVSPGTSVPFEFYSSLMECSSCPSDSTPWATYGGCGCFFPMQDNIISPKTMDVRDACMGSYTGRNRPCGYNGKRQFKDAGYWLWRNGSGSSTSYTGFGGLWEDTIQDIIKTESSTTGISEDELYIQYEEEFTEKSRTTYVMGQGNIYPYALCGLYGFYPPWRRGHRFWQPLLPKTPLNEPQYDVDGNEIPFNVPPGAFPMWGGTQHIGTLQSTMVWSQSVTSGFTYPKGYMDWHLGNDAQLRILKEIRQAHCCYRKVHINIVAANMSETDWTTSDGTDFVTNGGLLCQAANNNANDLYTIFVGGDDGVGGMDWIRNTLTTSSGASLQNETDELYNRGVLMSGSRGQCSDSYGYPDNISEIGGDLTAQSECIDNIADGSCGGNPNYFFALDMTNARQIAMTIGKMVSDSIYADNYPDQNITFENIPTTHWRTGEEVSPWTTGTGTVAGFCEKNSCSDIVEPDDDDDNDDDIDDSTSGLSGCTDPLATNYNASATEDDGTCVYDEYEESIVTDPNDPNAPECPPGYSATNIVEGEYIECECNLTQPAEEVDDLIPISLDDETYFKDISWTVSYDPKAKAWISFHDWHPDLMFPSLNHFLTTKNVGLGDPECPEGYLYNENTELCEITEELSVLADVNPVLLPCCQDEASSPLDIVFAIDTSGSTGGVDRFGTTLDGEEVNVFKSQILFFNNFINLVSDQMEAGQVQVGLTTWSGRDSKGQYEWLNCTPGQIGEVGDYDDPYFVESLAAETSLLLDGIPDSAIEDWQWNATGQWNYSMTNIPWQIGEVDESGNFQPFRFWDSNTNIQNSGLVPARNQLWNVDASMLGDRSSQNGYRRILVIMTDAENNDGIVSGCGTNGANNTELYAIRTNDWGYCYSELDEESQDNIRTVACESEAGAASNTPRVFGFGPQGAKSTMYVDPENPTDDEELMIATWVGSIDAQDIPDEPGSCTNMNVAAQSFLNNIALEQGCECNCEETFGSEYVQVGGDIPEFPPYCVKVDCSCKTNVNGVDVSGYELTTTGDCDDPYLYGMGALFYMAATYTNPFPLECHYTYVDTVEPTYEAGSIWRHNVRCDAYSNYYYVQYPWEIEFVESTGQIVNTVRNVEYEMEAYIYKQARDENGELIFGLSECDSRWHDLDFNFNRAYIYNTEQVSGYLHLNLSPKNDAPALNNYPSIEVDPINNANSYVDILYSKEEQKYRFNQFWDMTANRGEIITPTGDFDSNSAAAQQAIMWTDLNGYVRELNSLNLDYDKPPTQRKKFRHYWNKIVLGREPEIDENGEVIIETRKMLLKLDNTKINLSIR